MILGIDEHDSNQIMVIDDTEQMMTYGEIQEFTKLVQKHIKKRAIVFCLCENSIGALAGYISFLSTKTVPLLLGENIDGELFDDLFNKYTPKYIWLPSDLKDLYDGEIIIESYGYILIETSHDVYPLYEELSLLLTTSGSTGSPKLVRHSYENIEANAKNVADFFEWSKNERGICDLPIQYTMGLNLINSHLYSGATILLTNNNLMSPKFWEFIEKHKGTNFTGVPFSYEILYRLGLEKIDLPELHTIACGGGKLSDKLFEVLADFAQNTGKRFFSTYGTTETSARLAYLSPKLALQKTGCIGGPIPNGEMFLLDEHKSEITQVIAEGELGYRGPNVTLGYAENIEDLALGDIWNGEYHTGDMAKRDEDGHYYIVGRKNRFLKLYGLRVSLDMCEKLIKEKYKLDCVCTGTDKKMVIYIDNETEIENVKSYISKKTNIIKTAFIIRYLEEIPRSTSGKVLYNELPKI